MTVSDRQVVGPDLPKEPTVDRPQVLRGMTAVVTGGTTGLGRHLAEGFLAAGARVMCGARGARDVADLVADHADRAAYVPTDVRDPDSLRRLMAETTERFGRIDIVVANAGITRNGGVARLAAADWREVMNTNVDGVFHTVQAALPHLEAGGSILTVSSAMASRAVPGASAYATSKAAIEAFTRCCAVEFAARRIRVNCLSPGILSVGMGEVVGSDERLRQLYWPRMLAGRAGTPLEAVDAAVFLVSPAASYVNGHVFEVNGGLL
ncbi:SDR family NAD(P)-dependent oxidoreductase [Streptomyces europaeiscabiei]|nr:SDR family oxidoreductase [Streptomyces europaeiscabiei]MDX3584934.1 SDR family oxidoreductase [Streptomyces europaeiscabiei]MDX3619098.1 SDR family oxidoreductase [Streptomyces europaeiscabiei]